MRYLNSNKGAVLAGIAILFLAICALASYMRAYIAMPWIDLPLHFIFGAWFAAALMYYGYTRWLSIFLFVLLIGTAWEFFERGYDIYVAIPNGITPAQHGWSDTLSDWLVNVFGASVILVARRLGLNGVTLLQYTHGTPDERGSAEEA